MMLDFGLIDEDDMEEYDTRYLNELVPGDEIRGEIVIREFKNVTMKKMDVAEFYIIITDHTSHLKWVCEFVTPYSPEYDVIYGEDGDLFHSFFDSLNHVVNEKPLNWRENYSVNFSRFRDTINQSISTITVRVVKSDAEDVNLEVMDAEVITISLKPSPSTLYDLTQEDPVIFMAYSNLRNKGDRITIKNIQFELKSSLDDGSITETDYRTALSELKKIKPSVDIQ